MMFRNRRVKHEMNFRVSDKYFVNSSKTRRYQDSAVPYLQGLLNKDNVEKRKNLKRLLDYECSTGSLNKKRLELDLQSIGSSPDLQR